MKAKSGSVAAQVARVQDALKAGQLDDHAVVKSQTAADKQAPSRWGPMMRV